MGHGHSHLQDVRHVARDAQDVGSKNSSRRRLSPRHYSDERARLKQLERENKDLRRANANLKDASIFFVTELDGQTRR